MPSKKQRISQRARWSKSIETSSLQGRTRHLKEASRNFNRCLDVVQQMQLAREVATTRGAELTLAYENVVMVATGYKRKRTAAGNERMVRVPCIIFVVRRKWEKADDEKAGYQLLPKRLLAYATLNGERVLCAVPTDVQPEERFYKIAPTSARAVYVSDPPVQAEFGAITCAVEITGPSAKHRYVLSARHVFSPIPEIGKPRISAGISIAPLRSASNPPGASAIGVTQPYGGVIQNHLDPSFDVQLASITPTSWSVVREMLADMPLSSPEPYVATAERFDELIATNFFEILVPDNQPGAGMKARSTLSAHFEVRLPPSFSFEYAVRVNGNRRRCLVSHWELLMFRIANNRIPLPGDSGSPVVTWFDDGTCALVGMHIAGREGDALSLAIPSWQLFEVDNYLSLPSASRIRPINL